MPQDVYYLKVRPGVMNLVRRCGHPEPVLKITHILTILIHRKPVRQPHSLNIHTAHIDQKGLKDEKNDHSKMGNRLATGIKYR